MRTSECALWGAGVGVGSHPESAGSVDSYSELDIVVTEMRLLLGPKVTGDFLLFESDQKNPGTGGAEGGRMTKLFSDGWSTFWLHWEGSMRTPRR